MRRCAAVLVFGMCVMTLAAAPVAAQWFGKKTHKQPAATATPSHQGFAGYIRRLTAEAKAAAARGDLAQARNLAERAHKVSITGQPMLTKDPDCSPAATLALVQQLKSQTNTPAPAAAVAQSAPPKNPLELAPLLDQPPQQELMPPPPSPAPSVEPMPEAKLGSVVPQTVPSKPVRSPDAVAARPARVIHSTLDSARKRSPQTSSQQAAGFLSLQTDWLSPDADVGAVIEELADRPVRRAEPPHPKRGAASQESSAPKRLSSSQIPSRQSLVDEKSDRDDEQVVPPHNAAKVTTAIADSESQWELDVEHDSAEINAESAPQLSLDTVPPEPAIHADVSNPTPPSTRPSLGVWSPAAKQDEAVSSSTQVVSLSDFLDPAGNRVAADTPRMIETDFRQPAGSISARQPEADLPVRRHSRPVVSVADEPALSWLDTPADAKVATPAATDWNWSEWSSARKVMMIGMVLFATGMALFGLSFRWT